MYVREVNLPSSPELKANPISRLLLLWLVPFLKGGAKKDLTLEDVYHSVPQDASAKLGAAVEEKWNNEVFRAREGNRRPRLWKVIARLIWQKYSLVGLAYIFDELILSPLQTLALRNFIRTFEVENPEENTNHYRDQYLYAGVLVIVTFCHNFLLQTMFRVTLYMGIKCRIGASSLIYQKILRLHKSNSEQANVGKLCNLLSTDVGRLDQNFTMPHFLYIAPIQLCIYTYLLWNELGVSCFGGIGCVIFFLPLQFLTGRVSMYFRAHIARQTDERGRFLNEILAGIRLIKMYAWEKPFGYLISQLRCAEIKFIRRNLYFDGMLVCVHSLFDKLIPFFTIILYVAGGNTLTADKAFFTISVFNKILLTVMYRVPFAASQVGQLMASMNRIEEFMLSEDNFGEVHSKVYHFKDNIAHNGTLAENEKEATATKEAGEEPKDVIDAKIEMENYSASWVPGKQTLKNLSVNLRGNQLVVVIGHVGSGKSSFLNAILSELPYTTTEDGAPSYCHVQGRLSYASQEAWIFPATVRQNILFGLEMEEERYWKVIQLCCLEEDLKQFPHGDTTLVGERGVVLSGGQKARVNLARAIYQHADIYLLDDPLSAVNTKVGKALFQDCIRTHLEGKLRILVTHQLQYLTMADHVIVLNREGQIWGQGSYQELKNSGIDFTTLISEKYMNNDLQDVDEIQDQVSSQKNGVDSITTVKSSSGLGKEKEEAKEVGAVGMGTYIRYFKSGGSHLVIALLVSSFVANQVLLHFTDFWLSIWTNTITTTEPGRNNSSFLAVGDDARDNEGEGRDGRDENFYAYVYCSLMAAFIVVSVFRPILFYWYSMRISINLHDWMFQSLVRAPVKFFDDNPSGRVMNRFTKDLNHIDEQLPVAFSGYMITLLDLFGVLALNILANYYTVVPSVLMLLVLWKLRQVYLSSARDLNRIEALAKSPMFTHVTLTIQGLTTIRALKAQRRVIDQFDQIQDTHTAAYYLLYITTRWFCVWLELLSAFFLAIVVFGFLFFTTSAQGGNVGVAITAILCMAGNLQYGFRQSAETENFMTSVERVFEYSNLKPEASLETPEDKNVTPSWPEEGRLKFENISLAYDEASVNEVLKQISFSTKPREKVGIVGRTGAGKSSLITALFRLTEPCHGSITIDDVSLKTLGLITLRSRISIIPQDPVLFTGTLRYNLDPFEEFSDDRLWSVLKEVNLHHAVHNLDCAVADGGSNFSVGQRQLVCLARAMLRKNRVVVLDEATANVDPVTDNLVQSTIRSSFADCTILTIAHRLETVLDSDRIMVLDAGKVVEFDSPKILMKNEQSFLYAMLHHQQQQRNTETGESQSKPSITL